MVSDYLNNEPLIKMEKIEQVSKLFNIIHKDPTTFTRKFMCNPLDRAGLDSNQHTPFWGKEKTFGLL